MKHSLYLCSILICLGLLSSCAPSTLSNAESKGAKAMTSQEIFNLTSQNTLRLISSEFDAHVFFNEDGSLTAKSIFNNSTDAGSWDIQSDNKLCIKFNIWYFGDVNCYSTYKDPEKDQYLFFTTNGALAYTAVSYRGNSEALKLKNKKSRTSSFVRENLSKGQSTSTPAAANSQIDSTPSIIPANPSSSREEVAQTVKNLAQDCPGCNFEDADLRQAYLVGANLKGANLRGADLSRANLRRANLEGADLRGATLLSTNLPGANLKDANLSGADLTGSNLIQANLTDATMEGTIFDNTLQEGCKGL